MPPASTAGSTAPTDRKSVGEGKSVDLGGRRILKKKKKEETGQEENCENPFGNAHDEVGKVIHALRSEDVDSTDCTFVLGVFFSSRRRHTRLQGDWSSDVCSSDLLTTTTDAPGDEVLLLSPFEVS